jgi:hypothetical protein
MPNILRRASGIFPVASVLLASAIGLSCGQTPNILFSTPLQGAFVNANSVLVEGMIKGVNFTNHTLTVNGVVVPHNIGTGAFSTTVAFDPSEIFQPIVGELRFNGDNHLRIRKLLTVHRGLSVADGSPSLQSIALRLNDTGLNDIEPEITSLVELDLAELLPPGTVIINDYEYFCFFGCLTTDVVVNGGSKAPSLDSYALAVDALAAGGGIVDGVITLNGLFVSAEATALGCDIDISAVTSTINGDYDLGPEVGDPTNLGVTQLAPGVSVSFGGFSNTTDCGGGFGDGLLAALVNLFIGDVQTLVRDAFTDFLNTVPGGDDDPPIASAIEIALAGISISGPIGESLGVLLDVPIFSVPIDNAGITLGSDSTMLANVGNGVGQCPPVAAAPNLAASWHVEEIFPTFGATTPGGGLPYDLGLAVSTSAFNQLLKAQTECGLLVTDITEFSGLPITTGVISSALFFPQLAGVWSSPLYPARLEVRPTLAPAISGEPGPEGELAEMNVGHLLISLYVEDGGPPTKVLSGAVSLKVGINLTFNNAISALEFSLGNLEAEDVSVVLVDNVFGLTESSVENVVANLLPEALPALAESLGTFPIPSFFGLSLEGVEVGRNGQFMSLFADFEPAP